MCVKLSRQCLVKRILIVSMTNIGDVVLSCPVIDRLTEDFPAAEIDVVVGPKVASLFEGNPHVRVSVYDKQAPLRKKYAWFLDLYRRRYDVVVDVRHTMLAWLLRPRYARRSIFKMTKPEHKKERHLACLRQVYDYGHDRACGQYAVVTLPEDEKFFKESVGPALQDKSFVVIAPGAADAAKRWSPDGFAVVADSLSKTHRVVFVGDAQDALVIEAIQQRMRGRSLSWAGKTNLRQLAFVLKKSAWVLCHDSGVMHLACYLNVPVVALWGPTNLGQYSPWSDQSVVVRRNEQCLRCRDPKSKQAHQCMSMIKTEDVLNAIKEMQHF